MKIILDIPPVFDRHFNEDRFEDILDKIDSDIRDNLNKSDISPSVSDLLKLELPDMLIEAFKNAEPVKHGRWLHNDMILNRQKCSECGFYSDDLQSDNFCPNCGARMDGN